MLLDSHTHLNDEKLFLDWRKYLEEFYDKWWRKLINVWVDLNHNDRVIEICEELEKNPLNTLSEKLIVRSSLWIHPFDVVSEKTKKNNLGQNIGEIKKKYIEYKKYIVAIGECWIDLHYEGADENVGLQQELFRGQCRLADDLDLPLMIHSRDAFEETLEVLEEFKQLKIYFHCWGYWPGEIKILQEMFSDLWIWFCGNVTYKKAENLRESLKIVSLDNLLLETDAPYLAPQVVRWTTNHPANIGYLYEYIAELLDIKQNVLEKNIENNFLWLYGF